MATFADDFNRADSTDLGANWVEVSGDWSIVSNRLSPGAAGGTIILRAAGAMASSDNYAQVTIVSTTTASQGVWCRGNANISSGYLWRNNGSSWDLFAVVGGSFTVIGTYTAAAAPGDIAKVQAVGSAITAYVNGTPRVSVANTSVTTGVNVGIRADSASALRFDDFAAGDVTTGTGLTLTPAGATEAAQPLGGAKTAVLGPAAVVQAAQPVIGAKTGTLTAATASETAQALTGAKMLTLDSPAAVEAAQALSGSKVAMLGPAVETVTVQAFAGGKAALLPTATEDETGLPLGIAVARILTAATAVETARSLAGGKRATLGPAVETSLARPLVTAGPDVDIDVTVGPPTGSPCTVGAPRPGDWRVGAPC